MYKSVHYDKNCASCYQHLAYVHKCVYVYVFVTVCVCVMHGQLQSPRCNSRALTLSFKLLDHLRHEVVVVGLSPLLQGHSQSLVQPVKLYTEMHRQTHAQIEKKADTYVRIVYTLNRPWPAEGWSLYSVPLILHCLRVGVECTPWQCTGRVCVLEAVPSIRTSPHQYLVNLLQNSICSMHYTGHG